MYSIHIYSREDGTFEGYAMSARCMSTWKTKEAAIENAQKLKQHHQAMGKFLEVKSEALLTASPITGVSYSSIDKCLRLYTQCASVAFHGDIRKLAMHCIGKANDVHDFLGLSIQMIVLTAQAMPTAITIE